MWSIVTAQPLRARLSAQIRIVAMSYVAGGCVAALGLLAVLALTPTGEAVRDAVNHRFTEFTDRVRLAIVVGGAPVAVPTPQLPLDLVADDAPTPALMPADVVVSLVVLPSVRADARLAEPTATPFPPGDSLDSKE